MAPVWAQEAPDPAETPAPAEEPERKDFQRPSGGQLGIGGDEGFGLGTALGDPTALSGPDRTEVVLPGSERAATANITGRYLKRLTENSQFLIEANLDPAFAGVDLSYSLQPAGWEGVWSVNYYLSSGLFAPYERAPLDVRLLGDEQPFLQRSGGGVEYTQSFTEELDVAFALNYDTYAFSDAEIGGARYQTDFDGARLLPLGTQSRFATLRTSGIYSTLDDRNLPTEGTKFRFGTEIGAGLGRGDTGYGRVGVNLAQLVKAPGFNSGDHSFVFNLQAGSIAGSPPVARAFHLGGPFSVRGFDTGGLGSGTSFVQLSGEYRHHLTEFEIFDTPIALRATTFVDYASNLGTSSRVLGPPALRLRPDQGLGAGVGLQLATSGGLIRFEQAWNNDGGNAFAISVGERF